MPYIVVDRRKTGGWDAVVAPRSIYRREDGSRYPQMGEVRHAHEFATRRAAKKVAKNMTHASIIEVLAVTRVKL